MVVINVYLRATPPVDEKYQTHRFIIMKQNIIFHKNYTNDDKFYLHKC